MLTRRDLGRLTAGAVVAIACPALAQEVTAPDAMASAQPLPIDVRSNIEDLINHYIQEKGLRAREQRGEIAILTGFGVVRVPSNHPDWVKFRSLAYEQTLKDAKARWVQQQNRSITTSLVGKAYRAANQEPPPFKSDEIIKPAKLAEVLAKAEALGVGYLDQALRDLGLDPSKYEKAPPAQKHVQMSNDLIKVVTTRSIGDLVGLSTIQTYEGHDGKGHHEIGVIAVVSPKMKSFAQSILRLRGRFPADKSKAQDLGALITNKEALLQDFGTRWLYDANGLPALISFYQWGLDPSGNDPVLGAEVRNLAIKKATELADAQIAQFLAASATLTTQSTTGERFEKAVERAVDGYVSDLASTTKLIDGLDEVFDERSRVDHLTGLSTLTTWGSRHPLSSQMVVGVVRIWSAAGELATRAVMDSRPIPTPTAANPARAGAAGVVKGRDLNSADDF